MRVGLRRAVVATVTALCLALTSMATVADHAKAADDNNKIAFDFFVGKGLTKEQSAGIVGNLIVESGSNPIDPNAVQPDGPGRGIAQWSVGERWATLEQIAAEQGRSPWDLSMQLDFIWWEFNNTEVGAFNAVRGAASVGDAAIAFSNRFERCNPVYCHNERRVAHAQDVYNAYSDGQAPGGNGGGSGSGDVAGELGDSKTLPLLETGSSGAMVKVLQSALRAKGHQIEVDGEFGPATAGAVTSFQGSAGLEADGVVGKQTWAKVLPVLSKGSEGDAVTALQVLLRNRGHNIDVDGVFGPQTEAAVVEQQKQVGIEQDGACGPNTWGTLSG